MLDDVVAGITEDGTVGCVDCGAVHAGATGLLAELQQTVELLERDLRSKRAAIKRLQGDQAEAFRQSPHYSAAIRVLESWRDSCSPGAKELSGKRLELVIARLKKWSEDDLMRCVAGYARFPFVVDAKRSHLGTPQQWFAKAELIFREASTVEQGLRLAARQDVEVPLSLLATIPWRRVRDQNRKVLVEWLTAKMGRGMNTGAGSLIFFCPKCHDGDPIFRPLSVFDGDSRTLALCSRCLIGDPELLAMVAEDAKMSVKPAQIAML